ncbi:MAG: winged helix-turn-helix transcriptional regulator [bacterium]|nr:winged helix-turn-helix transcriptional regulator [bacterium]
MTKKKTDNRPLPASVLEQSACILRVLAHPHRLKIIELLASQEVTVGEVAVEVGIPPNACSQHLNMMKAHGVLSSRREGKVIYYRVEDPRAINVLDCIRRHST